MDKPRIYKSGRDWVLDMHGVRSACNKWEVAVSNLRMNLEHPALDMSRFVNPGWWLKHKLGKSDTR